MAMTDIFSIKKYFKKKYFNKLPWWIWSVLRGRRHFQMVGRVFDLRKKTLVKLNGFQMFVMPNDYIGKLIIDSKTYEPHITAVIRKVLKEGDVFLDIGANIGYFTMLASSVVKGKGKVIAIEPNPQNLQLIYSSLLENKISNVTVYPYAASDKVAILQSVQQ